MSDISQGLSLTTPFGAVGTFSMGSLLDDPIPTVQVDTTAKATYTSTAVHRSVNILGPWEPTTISADMRSLTSVPNPSPINVDTTLSPIDDTYRVAAAARHYIISPVSLALNHQIQSAQVKSRALVPKNNSGSFDIAWTYFSASAGKQVPFAAIHLVTPGAVGLGDWLPTSNPESAVRKAMGQQLTTYATDNKVDYIVAFDWQVMLLLKITSAQSGRGGWGYNTKGVYLKDVQKAKQHLFLFLREALVNKMAGVPTIAG